MTNLIDLTLATRLLREIFHSSARFFVEVFSPGTNLIVDSNSAAREADERRAAHTES